MIVTVPDFVGGNNMSAPRPKPAKTTISKAAANELQQMILSSNDSWLALNKPAGLAVQGGSGTSRHIDGLLQLPFQKIGQN